MGALSTIRRLTYVAGAVSALAAYAADNRAGIVLVIVDWIVIGAALGERRRRNLPKQAVGALAGLVATLSLLATRAGSAGFGSTLERFVLGKDLGDFSKVGVIVESGYSTSGNSLWHWMLAGVPERIIRVENEWNSIASEVWTEAYGLSGINGVPPSLPGELYAAFGWFGVVTGMFCFGLLTKKLYLLTVCQLRDRTGGALVCVSFLVRLTLFGLSTNLGVGVVKGILESLPLIVFLAYVDRSDAVEGGHEPSSRRSQRSVAAR